MTKKKLHRRYSTKKAALKHFAIFFYKIPERDSNTGISCEYCKILKDTYFEEHMPATASETCSLSLLLSSGGCVIVEYITLHNIWYA